MAVPALDALAATLAALSIRWVLIGALAANRYRSSPRLTQDIDILLDGHGPGLRELESALRAAGWSVRRADATGELLRLRHPDHGTADLLVAGTEYQREAIRRARTERIDDDTSVAVLTAEDVIVHKLIAGRAQDIADIEAILASGAPFDRAYVEHWARFWDVLEQWRSLDGPTC